LPAFGPGVDTGIGALVVVERVVDRQREERVLFFEGALHQIEQSGKRFLDRVVDDLGSLPYRKQGGRRALLDLAGFHVRPAALDDQGANEIVGKQNLFCLDLVGFETFVAGDEMLEDVEFLSRDEYDVSEIIEESFHDLDQLAEFLDELRKFKPRNDDKLKALIKLLKTDPVLTRHKVLIFSEYMATARYLREQLEDAGIEGVNEVDSATKGDRAKVIRQFAPYYNDSSSGGLAESGLSETRVLISTDVLSEGLNLQDATRLINYDLHWNPVRLMQRIGRIDRRMNPDIEVQILADHPDQKSIRGSAAYWNFLPPDELDDVLRLYERVSGKTLRISKTFGIEGRKLLKPTDEYDDLRDFNHVYEGTVSLLEKMHLEFQQLLKDHPDLGEQLNALPGKVFSGKAHPSQGSSAVFFCYALPAPRILEKGEVVDRETDRWTEEAGQTGWYLFDLDAERVIEEPAEMIDLIRCDRETPRKHDVPEKTLSKIRAKVEKHIKNSYLKKVQAPVGVKPTLKAWMELS